MHNAGVRENPDGSEPPPCRLLLSLSIAAAAAAAPAPVPVPPADALSPARVAAVRAYIKNGWTTLSRSTRDLAKAAPDPKFPRPAGQPWPVYLPPEEDRARVEAELKKTMTADDLARIELRVLPAGRAMPSDPGLLYLPRPYVVPGGRFNEMYGWDSYFIQVGLLADGETDRARDMVDNFLYEIEHYGTILNANRTYYLTRSQPPFLTEMILGVYEKTADSEWLRRTRPAIEKYYRFWTTEPHLVPETGLSRYYDLGRRAGAGGAERREGRAGPHALRPRARVLPHPRRCQATTTSTAYYDRAHDRLTDLFYKGDRSMRESGFDPSNRFGLFNVDIIHYTPVCLNSLLYRMETEAARIEDTLGNAAGAAAVARARARRATRPSTATCGTRRPACTSTTTSRPASRRNYEFATTFYPLWAGLASKEQAARVRANLTLFEAPGGLLTSTRVTGNQWDAPFGWAPLQMIAADGLRRYGYRRGRGPDRHGSSSPW